jgi:hypothetical protein
MKVLVAMELRSYTEVIAHAIQTLRPHLQVMVSEPGVLSPKVAHLAPDLVVCGQRDTLASDGYGNRTWVELSDETHQPAEIYLGGRRSKILKPGLEELLSVVDQTERIAQGKANRKQLS